MLNLKHLGILLILIIASATVAGCVCGGTSNNPAATPTVTPTPGPGPVTATPTAQATTQGATATPTVTPTTKPGTGTVAPTATPHFEEPKTTGEMFDYTRIHTVEYKSTDAGASGDTRVQIENLGKTTYKGFEAYHIKWNSTQVLGDGTRQQALIDMYQYVSNHTTAGGHMKVLINGGVFMDQDMDPVKLENVNVPAASSSKPLVKVGTEQITVGNRTYDCTKYSSTDAEGTSYYWYSPEVPFPVKYQVTDSKGTRTTELTEWS